MASKASTSQLPSEVPWPEPNGIYGHYNMHCHCGAIRWSMKITPPLYKEEAQGNGVYPVSECHCSYCIRNGSWTVHPFFKDVEWKQGLEYRVQYLTSTKQNPYWVCEKCHCVLGADLTIVMGHLEVPAEKARCAINVRMLEDPDPESLLIKPLKTMREFGPEYSIT